MAALGGWLKPCYLHAPRTLVRRVALTLYRPRGATRTVRLPWGGSLEVNAKEGIGRELMRQRVFDIAVSETAWRLLRPGDTAVDVGANVGYMSSLFAHRVGRRGRVESFEPHPRIFERLERNLGAIDSAEAIRVHQCALGDRDGSARLLEPTIFGINQGAAVVAARDTAPQRAAEGIDVRVARLDTVIADRQIALLKVDVEGFEPQVLSGAAEALSQHRIRHVIYEAHDCERSVLHARLALYGYSVFGIGHDLCGPRLSPGTAPPRIDRRWESPSYLATLQPHQVTAAMRPRGWRVLRP